MGDMAALAKELGGEVPAGFAKLAEADLTWLVETLRKTIVVKAEELEAATEETIRNLPIMLRGPVRAIMGGK